MQGKKDRKEMKGKKGIKKLCKREKQGMRLGYNNGEVKVLNLCSKQQVTTAFLLH